MSAQDLAAAFPSSGDFRSIEAVLRTLSGQASIGIFLSDPEGHTLYLNERLRRMAGLPTTPTAAECWLTALAPEDHDAIVTEWLTATEQARSFSREFRFHRPDGSLRWVMAEAFPLREVGSPPSGYVGMIRDITPRHLALEALHACEDRYRSLAALSSHPILVYADETILFMNDAGMRLFTLPPAPSIEGRSLLEVFPKEFLQDLPLANAVHGTESATPVERQYVRRDGTRLDMELVVSQVSFDGHSAIQVLATDITAQKDAAAQVRRAHKMAAVATLAGGIAHEFNNCLTAIMGFSDLALPLLVPDSRVYGHIQQVVLASKRARDLVTQMLMFGRQAEGIKQPVSLDILLKETLRLLKGTLPDNISLREWIPGATHPIYADPTQIHQVCVKLLAHSELAMKPDGGILEVRLDNVHLTQSTNAQDLPLRPGHYVCLTVSDTGEEVSAQDHRQKVGPLFAHLPDGTQAGTELAEVQRIVSEHGGTVRSTSTIGQGTTIEVYLPAILPPMSMGTAESPQANASDITGQKEFLAERDKER
ncbi:MAG: putative Histidine kinase [Nitrospira sp.]|nr:MAG: putative Histidine kinase [Nitrospira sp.]